MLITIFRAALCALIFAASANADERIPACDVLLRNGTIHDGSGQAAIVGDVAIKGDRIVAVGKFKVRRAGIDIDCTGLVVSPGFIDLHNHSDDQVREPNTRSNMNYLMQGCTTVVTGNCGAGPIHVKKYYDEIDAAGAGTNVAHLLPQGGLRQQVLATANRAATPEELDEMRKLARTAMQEGAWGMSTGLIYVPSSYATTDEIVELAKVVGEFKGIYASHIRGEGETLLASVREALDVGQRAKLAVQISHFKATGRANWGLTKPAIKLIEAARAAGHIVNADQYPYVASSTSLDAFLLPTWARAGGHKQLMTRLQDPTDGPRIRTYVSDQLDKLEGGEALQVARHAPHPEWAGKNLLEISRAEKQSVLELSLRMIRDGGGAMIGFSMNEDEVRQVMQLPWVATASDGRAYIPSADRPHPRSYGTFPRKIGHYALTEKTITLEQALRSCTGFPADILHLPERGYLRAGYFADIVVFDPQKFRDTATYTQPHRYATGVQHLFVNGVPTISEGSPTGTLAGRALSKTEPQGRQPPRKQAKPAKSSPKSS